MSDDEAQTDPPSIETIEDVIEASTDPPTAAEHAASGASPLVDLDGMEADLAGVEAALDRLEAGTYWTDEATGDPIPDDVLAADPVARRVP